jgi:hypothetical protein
VVVDSGLPADLIVKGVAVQVGLANIFNYGTAINSRWLVENPTIVAAGNGALVLGCTIGGQDKDAYIQRLSFHASIRVFSRTYPQSAAARFVDAGKSKKLTTTRRNKKKARTR